jgi:N-acyl-D-amino-acid deacylase
MAPEGVFLRSSTHPRAYGNFVRVLGKYARDEKTLTLPRPCGSFPPSPRTISACTTGGC